MEIAVIGEYRQNQWDEIRIEELEIYAKHGVFPEEQQLGQKFLVSASLFLDLAPAGRSDDLSQSVDYGMACHLIASVMTEKTYQLLETAAEKVGEALLHLPGVEEVSVTIKKPWAPIGLPLKTASVTIRRSWHTAFIALGSNMGDKNRYIADALEALRSLEDVRIQKVSTLITTKPYGGVVQDDFVNGAMKIRTLLDPQALLALLHQVEQQAGRTREIHWGPRTLDLDILFYDDAVISTEDLTVPHCDLQNRDFVLRPMDEIAPDLVHPLFRKTIRQMLTELEERGKN